MLKSFKFYMPLMVFAFLAVVFLFALNLEDKENIPSPLVGKRVPEFSLPSLDGQQQVTHKIFFGQAVLLNIWGSWCPSCYAEHEYLTELAHSGVVIVGLNYKDKRDKAQEFLKNLGNPYQTVIFDVQGSLGIDLGVYGAPETYLIDAQGKILTKRVGVMTASIWEQQFKPLWLLQ